jgi:hypothetical protein
MFKLLKLKMKYISKNNIKIKCQLSLLL